MYRKTLLLLAVAATFLIGSTQCLADILVGEDFFYKEPSRTDTSFGDVRFALANYGGGANGPLGTWESKWVGLGAGSIIGDDTLDEPFVSNPYTSRFSGENVVNNDIQRDFSISETVDDEQTLYFGGQFMTTEPAAEQATFAEFGIFATDASGEEGVTTVASVGIQNGTFFAHAGARDLPESLVAVTLGDPDTVANDAVVPLTYYTVIGKLEFNVGGPSTVADFNNSGSNDLGDYTIWRDNFGATGATFEQGDATGDGNVDADDYQVWKENFGAFLDRVTAYINPTGVETSNGSTLVAEAEVGNGIRDAGNFQQVFLSGGYNLAGTPSSADAFIDDMVIGTEWDDVTSLVVPRLDLEVNTTTGDVTFVNNTGEDIDLAVYEIVSESGSLNTSWDSLDEQGVDGGAWLENSPTEFLLTESNLAGATTLLGTGGSLTLAGAFDTAGTQDLIARFGEKEGNVGLYNLANVSYGSAAAAISTAVPEPSGVVLLTMLLGAAVCGMRRW